MSIDNHDSELISYGRYVYTFREHHRHEPEAILSLTFAAADGTSRFTLPLLSRDDLTRLRDLIDRQLAKTEPAATTAAEAAA